MEDFRFASTSINPASVADLREFRVTRIDLEETETHSSAGRGRTLELPGFPRNLTTASAATRTGKAGPAAGLKVKGDGAEEEHS